MEESPRAQRQSEITRTALGRSVVEVMAYGCIQEMLKGKLPFTDEGFQALVEHSRVTGLKGKISFQMQGWTQRRMQALFASSGLPMRFIEDANLEGFRKKPSLRNRMLDVGLGPADTSLPDGEKQERLERFRSYLGEDAADVLEALRYGDCQRDLVWKRIQEICTRGDPQRALEEFRATSPTAQEQ
ncbi:hypothetical protein FJZ27_01865 [Candidatus Peribacteria bacterium]|nr:hypothetical protein [Candidatus Peribacteria bacterium]